MIDHYSPTYEKLENWIRGSTAPGTFESGQFEQWHKAAKKARPFRYWLAETLLYKLVALINWPGKSIHHLVYASNNRWISTTHALTAHPKVIPRGEWRDLGDRFLPCMFKSKKHGPVFAAARKARRHTVAHGSIATSSSAPGAARKRESIISSGKPP